MIICDATSDMHALGDGHSILLASFISGCQSQSCVCAGAVAYLAPLVVNQDAKLKRQVSSLLS